MPSSVSTIYHLRDHLYWMYATSVTSGELSSAHAMMDGLIMDFIQMEPNFKLAE